MKNEDKKQAENTDNSNEKLLLSDIIKSVCVNCGTDKDIRVIDGSYWCKKCRKG